MTEEELYAVKGKLITNAEIIKEQLAQINAALKPYVNKKEEKPKGEDSD